MSDQIAAAFRRAAKVSPLYRPFQLYKAVDALNDNGRPVGPVLYDWIETAPGAVRWKEVDANSAPHLVPLVGLGEGVVTILAPFTGAIPDALLDAVGQWYLVANGEGEDTLGVGYRLIVSRWTTQPLPVVRNAAP